MRSSERGGLGRLPLFRSRRIPRSTCGAQKKRRHQGGAEDASAPATGEGGVAGVIQERWAQALVPITSGVCCKVPGGVSSSLNKARSHKELGFLRLVARTSDCPSAATHMVGGMR